MTCPRSESIARLIAEDLPVAEARALEQHLQGCTTCSRRRDDTVVLLAALGPAHMAEGDGEAFVRDTLRRLGQERPSRAGASWKLLAAAAVVLVALPVAYLGWRQLGAGEGTFTPRGRGAAVGAQTELEQLVGVLPLLVRKGRQPRLLQPGEQLRAADRLTCRYSNISSRSVHMMAFALDAAGEVHWLFPAYLDESTDPKAVPLEARARARVMPEVVQPEGVAPGPLRVVTLVMTRPLSVKQVERLVQGRDPREPVDRLFSAQVQTQQWLVRMEAANAR